MTAPLISAMPEAAPVILPRLWVYTNFDCNLTCTYCLASSSPSAPRRAVPLDSFIRLIDEAHEAGISDVFLTGGEPFLLPDIFDRIEYASRNATVTILTNALLLRGNRLKRLAGLRDAKVTLQVSLDGHIPALHDAYRGAGTWRRTVESIRQLVKDGFQVSIGATETPLNAPFACDLLQFATGLGVPEERFFMRPLTRNGYSAEGLQLGPEDVVPELTVTLDGVYWHPQAGGAAHLLSRSISPLSASIEVLHATYDRIVAGGPRPQPYRCA